MPLVNRFKFTQTVVLLTKVLDFVMPSHLSGLLHFELAFWEYRLVCMLHYLLVLLIRVQGVLRPSPAQFGRENYVHSISADLLVLIYKVLTK